MDYSLDGGSESLTVQTLKTLLSELPQVNGDEEAHLLHMFSLMTDDQRVRGLVQVGTAERVMKEGGAEMFRTFEQFTRGLPRFNNFSYTPLSYILLIYFRAATLLFPGVPLRKAMFDRLKMQAIDFCDSVFAKPIVISADGDIAKFFENFVTMPNLFLNFGKHSFERVSARHVRAHYEKSQPLLGEYVFEGAWTAFAELYEKNVEVYSVINSDDYFEMNVHWS